MKYGKKLCVMALVVMMIINNTGCFFSREKSKEKANSIKIGISVYDHYDTFIGELMDSLNAYAKEKETITGVTIWVDIENAAGSQSEQNSQVEDFISNGCDVVCVNLVDRTDPTTIIDKARNVDIPVIFFNRELVEEDLERWDKLYYVGAAAVESGVMQGQIIVDACRADFDKIDKNQDGILQYVMLEGEAGHQDAIVRTEYSVNTVVEAGIKVEKLAYAIANWNRAQAQTKVSQWIEQMGDQIEVVFANNDDMALGAIDAYKAAKIEMKDFPVIIGIDGTQVGLEAVEEGTMQGTVLNDQEGQAKAIVELCYSLVMEEELSLDVTLIDGKYIRLPYKIVKREDFID